MKSSEEAAAEMLSATVSQCSHALHCRSFPVALHPIDVGGGGSVSSSHRHHIHVALLHHLAGGDEGMVQQSSSLAASLSLSLLWQTATDVGLRLLILRSFSASSVIDPTANNALRLLFRWTHKRSSGNYRVLISYFLNWNFLQLGIWLNRLVYFLSCVT